ncbi:MAG: rhodanese-like domain-containing protein [Alphaproteobacteria bacterium]|nr:rhodanese-like domain-containing protein [Alphaproteobacteria bacterium]
MTWVQSISAEQLKQRGNDGGVILDVRTAMEHGEKRLVCAHAHVPLDTLDPATFMRERNLSEAAPVYILCRSGTRARQAADKFVAAGFKNVFVISGGIVACAEFGQEVEGTQVTAEAEKRAAEAAAAPAANMKGLAALPLEQQVRVVAGAVAALGALLGMTSSSVFTIIPFAVGCGLLYSGLTGDCRLALLLTKAPWNQQGGHCSKPACCGGKSESEAGHG